MKRRFLLLLSLLLCYNFLLADSILTKEDCRALVKDLERMSNINPRDIETKAPETLQRLRNGETLTSYFIAYNIYVENLVNQGKVEKAQKEIEKMLEDAFEQSNIECQVIALRTQGQFYFKLGLYERAASCFRKAMEICPPYDSELLEHCFTWSSTLFWLVQADIRIGRLNDAEQWINQMDKMMEWLEATGVTDQIGYKPVMIRGLKAKIELMRGNGEKATELLNECPQYICEGVPSRAYVEYYVAQMMQYIKENRHKEALPLLNELIDMHISDYKPIAAEYLYQKGLSLAELGRFEESTAALTEYINLKEQINKAVLAQQLDELTTRYKVEKLMHERDNIRRQLIILLSICLALAIIITLIIASQKRLRQKNKILARNISELNRLARESAVTTSTESDTTTSEGPTNAELIETGNKIVAYINQTKCYLHAD